MTREEIIKGLECCAHIWKECKKCPYYPQKVRHATGIGGPCTSFLADDALKLLEEQREAEDGNEMPVRE